VIFPEKFGQKSGKGKNENSKERAKGNISFKRLKRKNEASSSAQTLYFMN